MASDNSASQLAAMAAFKASNLSSNKSGKPERKTKLPLRVDTVKRESTTQRKRNPIVPRPAVNTSGRALEHRELGQPRDVSTASPSEPVAPVRTPVLGMLDTAFPGLPATKNSSAAPQTFGSPKFGLSQLQRVNSPAPLSSVSRLPPADSDLVSNHAASEGERNVPKIPAAEGFPKRSNLYQAPTRGHKKLATPGIAPQQMIDSIRNSIKSKSKSNVCTEMSPKNQIFLNEIRESIDLKRVSTAKLAEDNASSGVASTGTRKSPGTETDNKVFYSSDKADSKFSLDSSSSLEAASDYLTTPTIAVNDFSENSSDPQVERPYRSLDDSMESFNVHSNDSNNLRSDHGYSSFKEDSDDEYQNRTNDESLDGSDSQSNKAKIYLKRKPPPDRDGTLSSFEQSLEDLREEHPFLNMYAKQPNYIQSAELLGGGSGTSNEDLTISDQGSEIASVNSNHSVLKSEKEFKLPKFPDIEEDIKNRKKHSEHRHLLFRHKHHKMIDLTINFLDHDNSDSDSSVPETLISEEMPQQSPSTQGPQQAQSAAQLNNRVQLKSTMRDCKKIEKKNQFNENKPWKNHKELGYITETEKKRYEGVWASNKGNYLRFSVKKLRGIDYDSTSSPQEKSLISAADPSLKAAIMSTSQFDLSENKSDTDRVHNLSSADISQLISAPVIRRIWERSRLPKETLKLIWDLVDCRHDGTLNKNEFIVGMWLIDQCLYGRKLPKKVGPAVWDSVGNIGINVVVKKKGRK